MALASTGYFATVTCVDSGGNKSTLTYRLSAATIADALTDAATIITRLNAVTDAVILSYRVGEQFEEDSAYYAAAGVQIEDRASLSCVIDAGELKYATLLIPSPTIGIFVASTGPNSNVVDPADTDLVTYLTTFATGGIATLSDGETLLSPGTAGNVTGKRIHRGSRKG